jgi:hypothetical protein
VDAMLELNPRLTWQEAVMVLVHHPNLDNGYAIALRYYLHPTVRMMEDPQWHQQAPLWRFRVYWTWALEGGHQPAPDVNVVLIPAVIPPALGRIAGDAQNVHTTAVSNQTNAGMEKILKTTVPREQQTEKCMVSAWLAGLPTVSWNAVLKTSMDVNHWFNVKSCRAENDTLYRNMLRGLVAMINRTDDEQKVELYKRLWEECREATGMCCEGHITRLCNVMVGFDDAFRPPVALGDLMQQKMAAIAMSDLSTLEKLIQARTFFDEVGVPEADRAAWLDAF